MLVAMFVFGQIPITDTILSRYVPDNWRARVCLSVKFMVDLTIGATVLPVTGRSCGQATKWRLFTVMSILAVLSSSPEPASRSGRCAATEPCSAE